MTQVLWAMVAGVAGALGVGGGEQAPSAEGPKPVRVGGDVAAEVERVNGEYRFGKMRIETPLPEGYPAPTPPGAVEIKRYPLVRRAEVTMRGAMPDGGFWPLFMHIQRRDIAMTSPVEMDFHGTGAGGGEKSATSTMSFLYRTAGMGKIEEDGRVRVRDVEPMTVVSVGFQGAYASEKPEALAAQLREWLAANPAWQPAGDVRMLCYNGPDTPRRLLWGEVQIPVRERDEKPEPAPAAEEEGGGQ